MNPTPAIDLFSIGLQAHFMLQRGLTATNDTKGNL